MIFTVRDDVDPGCSEARVNRSSLRDEMRRLNDDVSPHVLCGFICQALYEAAPGAPHNFQVGHIDGVAPAPAKAHPGAPHTPRVGTPVRAPRGAPNSYRPVIEDVPRGTQHLDGRAPTGASAAAPRAEEMMGPAPKVIPGRYPTGGGPGPLNSFLLVTSRKVSPGTPQLPGSAPTMGLPGPLS